MDLLQRTEVRRRLGDAFNNEISHVNDNSGWLILIALPMVIFACAYLNCWIEKIRRWQRIKTAREQTLPVKVLN